MFWSTNVKQDEEIIFFPTLGFIKDNRWQINIHGWIFDPEFAGALRQLFRRTTGINKRDDDDNSFSSNVLRLF